MSTEGDRTEVARIVIGHAEKLCIHTGNIINWKLLKKLKFHPFMTATDEVSYDALSIVRHTMCVCCCVYYCFLRARVEYVGTNRGFTGE